MRNDVQAHEESRIGLDLQQIAESISTAMKNVESDYLEQPLMGLSEKAIYRSLERVYAYELYHQMRLQFAGSDFSVAGEPVKRSSAVYYRTRRIPDLIIHKPASSSNLAVIEIKSVWNLGLPGQKKDAGTADEFVKCLDYKHSVFICFGVRDLEKIDLDRLRVSFSVGLQHKRDKEVLKLW